MLTNRVRFPHIQPGEQKEVGDHFLALFPKQILRGGGDMAGGKAAAVASPDSNSDSGLDISTGTAVMASSWCDISLCPQLNREAPPISSGSRYKFEASATRGREALHLERLRGAEVLLNPNKATTMVLNTDAGSKSGVNSTETDFSADPHASSKRIAWHALPINAEANSILYSGESFGNNGNISDSEESASSPVPSTTSSSPASRRPLSERKRWFTRWLRQREAVRVREQDLAATATATAATTNTDATVATTTTALFSPTDDQDSSVTTASLSNAAAATSTSELSLP